MVTGYSYVVYIATDKEKSKFSVGVTGDLPGRVYQLEMNAAYKDMDQNDECRYLLYWESLPDIKSLLEREKQIRKLSLKKKKALVDRFNAKWEFLNNEISEDKTRHLL